MRRTAPFPHDAEAIHVEWAVKEGGIQAAAWTDGESTAYIALKILNCIGRTTGLYDWERADTLTSDRVVGFIESRPLIVCVTVNVTSEGLELIVRLPPDISPGSKFEERIFAPWGSGAPRVSIRLEPEIDHYATRSFPTE